MVTSDQTTLLADDGFDAFEEFDGIMRSEGENPYHEYAWARRDAPVRYVDPAREKAPNMGAGAQACYRVYRWADVTRVLRDTDHFNSSYYNDTIELVFGRTILGMDGDAQPHRLQSGAGIRRVAAAARLLHGVHRPATGAAGAGPDQRPGGRRGRRSAADRRGDRLLPAAAAQRRSGDHLTLLRQPALRAAGRSRAVPGGARRPFAHGAGRRGGTALGAADRGHPSSLCPGRRARWNAHPCGQRGLRLHRLGQPRRGTLSGP